MIEIGKLTKHDLLLMLRDQEIEITNLKSENEKLRDELAKDGFEIKDTKDGGDKGPLRRHGG